MVLEVGKVDKFKLSNNNENKSSVLSAVFLKHELWTVCCIFLGPGFSMTSINTEKHLDRGKCIYTRVPARPLVEQLKFWLLWKSLVALF